MHQHERLDGRDVRAAPGEDGLDPVHVQLRQKAVELRVGHVQRREVDEIVRALDGDGEAEDLDTGFASKATAAVCVASDPEKAVSGYEHAPVELHHQVDNAVPIRVSQSARLGQGRQAVQCEAARVDVSS